MLFRPFKGAKLGEWYQIELYGTRDAEIPVRIIRIADIFETRLAGAGSVKNGPYQVCLFLKGYLL